MSRIASSETVAKQSYSRDFIAGSADGNGTQRTSLCGATNRIVAEAQERTKSWLNGLMGRLVLDHSLGKKDLAGHRRRSIAELSSMSNVNRVFGKCSRVEAARTRVDTSQI